MHEFYYITWHQISNADSCSCENINPSVTKLPWTRFELGTSHIQVTWTISLGLTCSSISFKEQLPCGTLTFTSCWLPSGSRISIWVLLAVCWHCSWSTSSGVCWGCTLATWFPTDITLLKLLETKHIYRPFAYFIVPMLTHSRMSMFGI